MYANLLQPAEIFTLFFVMLGPLKLLGPFTQRTRDVPDSRRIAWYAFLLATLGAIAGGFLGTALLDRWHVSFPALTIGGGVIFFLVAIQQLMAQYRPRGVSQPDEPLPASPLAAAMQIVFPIVLTPYGIAAVIALLAKSDSNTRTMSILVILVLVMLFDLFAMLFARRILVGLVPIILQVLGAVLAVLQLALSIQFILRGLHDLHIVPG